MIRSARSNVSRASSKKSHRGGSGSKRGNLSNRGGAAVIVNKAPRDPCHPMQLGSESTIKMSDNESVDISNESNQRIANEEAEERAAQLAMTDLKELVDKKKKRSQVINLATLTSDSKSTDGQRN